MMTMRRVLQTASGRARAQDQDTDQGSATVMALVLIMLLTMTSAVFVSTTSASVSISKEGRDFATARQASKVAAADALNQMNRAIPLAETAFPTAAAPKSVAETVIVGSWKWWVVKTAAGVPERLYVQGTTGSVGATKNTQAFDYPLRSTYVGSFQVGDSGSNVYGVPGGGVFKHVLATSDNATLKAGSTVVGDVGIFGNGVLTSNGAVPKAIGYSDNAANTGGKVSRSTTSARLDKKLVKDKADWCTTNNAWIELSATVVWPGSLTARATPYCYSGVTFGEAVIPSGLPVGTGVVDVVLRGNVTFTGDISASASSQMHFYSTQAGGVVTFAPASTATVNAQIFAANSECKTATGKTLNLNGSLACRSISELNGSFTYVAPRVDTITTGAVAPATKKIYYLEASDYSDSMNP